MKQPIDTKGLQSIVDGQLALGLKAVEAVEQLGALQLNTTKALLEQSVKQHQALLGVKTPQDLGAIANDASKPLAQITQNYLTEATALARDTSRAVALTTEAQVQEGYRAVSTWLDEAAKAAPAGSESFFKAAREMIAVSEKAWGQFIRQTESMNEQAELYVVSPANAPKGKSKRST
jgi:phasin family protein